MSADDNQAAAPDPKSGGIVFLPLHGVQLTDNQVPCHGLLFLRVDGQTWSHLEALWMRDQELDLWIAARKQDPSAHLAPSVMKEIQKASQTTPHPASKPEYPSWLLASACLIAGIGKLGLIFRLAF